MWTVLTILHIVIATLVTSHVLLTKSQVRSAIGWIGLGWLSPFFGGAIYFALGINRVARRASRRLHAAARSSQRTMPTFDCAGLDENINIIARVGDQVTINRLTAGNHIAMLQGGNEAYPLMLAEIAKARRTIALASYIFRADEVGDDFIEALKAAHGRGVAIRVLVDGIGGGYFFSAVIRRLRDAGIPAQRFMHDWRPWQMSFINLRNHKKLLIIDGKTGFTGGLNLGDENLLPYRRGRGVYDVHFRINGPVVNQLMASFAEDWNFTTEEDLTEPGWWPEIAPAGDAPARVISSGPDEDIGKIEVVLAAAIGQAKQRLRIVTPYFLPDERLRQAIELAALRGVEIDLVVPEKCDHSLINWALRSFLSFFRLDLVKVFMTSGAFDHSKLVTVDGKWCAFGSTNWDVRSLRLNFEILVECYGEQTVNEIDSLIDEKIAGARPFGTDELASRPLPHKLRDASARLLLPYL